MKRPQTKFHAHTMRESQVIRSKFSCRWVFSLHRYFIENTTTDIDMLLQV